MDIFRKCPQMNLLKEFIKRIYQKIFLKDFLNLLKEYFKKRNSLNIYINKIIIFKIFFFYKYK